MSIHCTKKQPRPQRQAVLIALHPDGFVEVFGERHVDVLIARVPHCSGSEVMAEDTFELLLPWRYRQLYWPGMLRASAMNRPLLPSTMTESRNTKQLIIDLNNLKGLEAVA